MLQIQLATLGRIIHLDHKHACIRVNDHDRLPLSMGLLWSGLATARNLLSGDCPARCQRGLNRVD